MHLRILVLIAGSSTTKQAPICPAVLPSLPIYPASSTVAAIPSRPRYNSWGFLDLDTTLRRQSASIVYTNPAQFLPQPLVFNLISVYLFNSK
ncbi:hypothetical protein F5Y12DRAFT_775931 [Xylaria sp. FL1777]|nr:hypothetical protein F5Y12DRAFT_775931 [Xylaria sp. FL1777]